MIEIEIPAEKYFYVNNGHILKNKKELLNALKSINENSFNHHVNDNKNDFSNWLLEVFLDKNLAQNIAKAKTKHEMIEILSEHLNESSALPSQIQKIKIEKKRGKTAKKTAKNAHKKVIKIAPKRKQKRHIAYKKPISAAPIQQAESSAQVIPIENMLPPPEIMKKAEEKASNDSTFNALLKFLVIANGIIFLLMFFAMLVNRSQFLFYLAMNVAIVALLFFVLALIFEVIINKRKSNKKTDEINNAIINAQRK